MIRIMMEEDKAGRMMQLAEPFESYPQSVNIYIQSNAAMNPRYVQNYRSGGRSPQMQGHYGKQNSLIMEKLMKPKHVTLLEKSLKVNEMQEKKLEEQEKVLRDVTKRYLELDIKYTELMHEHKLVQDENAKLREHILKLEGADKGAKETTQKQKQTDQNKDSDAKNEDGGKRKSGETFVETFTDRLQMQLEDKDGIVSDVDPKGAAAKQGISKGDKIISINGAPLRMLYGHTTNPNAREISAFINQSRKSDGKVTICVQRQ